MLKHALKEWAAICEALAEGRQQLILRKGGIAEPGDGFRLKHTRFWLYPTYTHQQRKGLRDEGMSLLEKAERERPPAGAVRLTHFAEVDGVYHVRNRTAALILAHLHFWSEEAVAARFDYRTPGLNVLPLRVYRAERAFEIPERPEYQGCHSWVELEEELPDENATPVRDAEALRELHHSLDLLLRPTALA
jgi:hypothetical protein